MATIGSAPHDRAQRDAFADLAAADSVGSHQWVEDPSHADAIMFVDLQQHADDPFLRGLRHHALVRAYREKVYVYDARDQPVFTFPGIYVAGTPRWARRRAMRGGPYPVLMNPLEPADRVPDLLYSFQGSRTHLVRDVVLALAHPRGYVEDTTAIDFFAWGGSVNDNEQQARSRYAEIVARSKFVLCPRGHGPSTFRLYETLRGGRVPVVISDAWLAPPRIDWDRCAVHVAEADAGAIPRLLEAREDDWPGMVAAGREAVAEHFATSRLWDHFATSVAELHQRPRPARRAWWAQSAVLRIAARRARAAARGRRRR